MCWCYGIIRHKSEDKKYTWYQIHEIFHGEMSIGKGKNKKIGYTENGIVPTGDSPKELIDILKMMLNDLKKCPVFDYETGKRIKCQKQR